MSDNIIMTADELFARVRAITSDALRLGTDLLQSAAGSTGLSRGVPSREADCGCGCGSANCGCGRRNCGCGCGCNIPETQCPPRCVCRMRLGAMTGQPVTAEIRVINEAAETRTFNVTSTPLHAGSAVASFAFAPASLTIAPGVSALTTGTLTVPTSFPKGRYECEILVTGAYEQCVEVALEVGCDDIPRGFCSVVEQERRFRIRAHHWYDHFQCVVPCGPPPVQNPRDTGSIGTSTL